MKHSSTSIGQRRIKRIFVPSASFLVLAADGPPFAPRFQVRGRSGKRLPVPRLLVHEGTASGELVGLLAKGEVLLLAETRN